MQASRLCFSDGIGAMVTITPVTTDRKFKPHEGNRKSLAEPRDSFLRASGFLVSESNSSHLRNDTWTVYAQHPGVLRPVGRKSLVLLDQQIIRKSRLIFTRLPTECRGFTRHVPTSS